MDHDLIVQQLHTRCKWFIENNLTGARPPPRCQRLARRYVCVLVTAEDLAVRINEVIHEAGWDRIPTGEILGDEAAWIRDVPDTPYSGVRQTLDYYQLSE